VSAPLSKARLDEIRASVAAAPHPAPGTWALALRELLAEVDRLGSERDSYCDRVDTLTAVAKGNKRHVQEMYTDLQKAHAELAEARARVAELEAAAYGDATVRLFTPVEQIRHLHEAVAAQLSRANTLDRLCREQRERADGAEAAQAPAEPVSEYVPGPEAHASMRAYLRRHFAGEIVPGSGACSECGEPPEQWCPQCAGCGGCNPTGHGPSCPRGADAAGGGSR